MKTNAPVAKLATNRGLLKMVLFNFLTLGIYSLVVYSKISSEINLIATKHDGKSTMHYCLICFIFSWLTLGIAPVVWMHRICNRIGNELNRRKVSYSFSATDFWLWGVLGSFILIGPLVFVHKFLHAMNNLNADYNVNG